MKENSEGTLTVFFGSLNEAEILEVAEGNIDQVLFSFKPNFKYKSSKAVKAYWHRHLCSLPEFSRYLDLTQNTGYYSSPQKTEVIIRNSALKEDKGLEALFFEHSLHLNGLFQLYFVLAEIKSSSIILVTSDDIYSKNITGLSSTNTIKILALMLTKIGKKTYVLKDNKIAIKRLKENSNFNAINESSTSQLQYFSKLEFEEQQDNYSGHEIALDLSFLRHPQQYYDLLRASVHTNKHLLFYNDLAQLWGNVSLFPSAKILKYTYAKHTISEELSSTCNSFAENISFDFGYCNIALLRSYARDIEGFRQQLLMPNIASWLIGREQIHNLMSKGFNPKDLIGANVHSVVSCCIRSELKKNITFTGLPHSFTSNQKDGRFYHTIVLDCPQDKIKNEATKLLTDARVIPDSDYIVSKTLSFPIKFQAQLDCGYKRLRKYAWKRDHNKLQIGIFLNADWFFGYWISAPQRYAEYLQQVAIRLTHEDIPFVFKIICKGLEQTPECLEILLSSYLQRDHYDFISSSGGLSLSKSEWFDILDMSLFIGHGSINVEVALACIPAYVFDAEFQLFSPLQYNYTDVDIKPRVVQRSDIGSLEVIFSANEMALEAVQQCHHVLRQTSLLRRTSPQLLR